MKFSILQAADEEMVAAAERYQEQQDELGHRFLDAVGEAFQRMIASPQCWPRHEAAGHNGPARYVQVADFPYRVIYIVISGTAQVVAVAHTSRRSDYWVGRTEYLP